jgi:hypothetical protein
MKPKKTKPSSEAQKGKSKAKAKSLEIRKETIESLSDDELDAVKGGRAVANTAGCTKDCKAAFFSVGCHGK